MTSTERIGAAEMCGSAAAASAVRRIAGNISRGVLRARGNGVRPIGQWGREEQKRDQDTKRSWEISKPAYAGLAD